ncbi:MAG: GTP-binding protein [Clostridia bacterium]|nr:GTP-binding protein [Clostridia bacterium]
MKTKIDIFSGFLGAGKTTLIKKLIAEAYDKEKIVLIENEFGEIGVDSAFLAEAGIKTTEMNSGCICCSLVGDFSRALEKVIEEYAPERILIEPSGVGKLSDVIRAVESVQSDKMELNAAIAVVDAKKCKMYMKNFGEFFNNQIEHAGCIILSHTAGLTEEKIAACIERIREHNPDAVLVTTEWDALTGAQILTAMGQKSTLADELAHLEHEAHHHHEHHHHHDHDEHDEHCECGCHDHDHEHHHHHDHDEHCECGCHDHEHEHHHHHDHDEHCECGCHDHDHEHHHHHHHADEVFTSWGRETARAYTDAEMEAILSALENEDEYGTVLRAKGIVSAGDHFIHFDYVPGTPDVRHGEASVIGRICVIGAALKEDNLAKLFGLA